MCSRGAVRMSSHSVNSITSPMSLAHRSSTIDCGISHRPVLIARIQRRFVPNCASLAVFPHRFRIDKPVNRGDGPPNYSHEIETMLIGLFGDGMTGRTSCKNLLAF